MIWPNEFAQMMVSLFASNAPEATQGFVILTAIIVWFSLAMLVCTLMVGVVYMFIDLARGRL